MSRSRSLLQILSDPHSIDPLNKKPLSKKQKIYDKQAEFNNIEPQQREIEKNVVDLSNLSAFEVKQIQSMRKNQQQINKNMSDYEQNQLLKLQKQILSCGDTHIIPNPSERYSESVHEETFYINPKDNNDTIQVKQKNKLLVYPKIKRAITEGNETNPQLDQSVQKLLETNQEVNQSKFRSLTEHGDREKQWPGKYPLYSKNIDKINLSCQYLKFKQECINKTDEICQVTNNYKQLASPTKIYNQLSKQPSMANMVKPHNRASTSQDLPPLSKQHRDPFSTIAQFNPSVRRIGMAEFKTDFSFQETAQELKNKNLQKNLYNQLIQQKLKLNQTKKPLFIKEKSPKVQNKQNEMHNKNTQNEKQMNQTKQLIFNLLPQLLKSKSEKIHKISMVDNEERQFDVSPQAERIQKINKIMAMKINKKKKLRQSNSLAQIDSNQKVIYHIGNSIKEIDKSKNIGEYIDQLKSLNDNIKKQLQQQVQLNQPSLQNKKKTKRNDNNILQFLNKSEQPFYNLSYYKIDMNTNMLQKVHKTPQYTIREDVNQELLTNSQPSSILLPSLQRPYLSQQQQELSISPSNDTKEVYRKHDQSKFQQQQQRGRQEANSPKQKSKTQNSFNMTKQQQKECQITSPLISSNQRDECFQIQQQNLDHLHKNQINILNNNKSINYQSQEQFDDNLKRLLETNMVTQNLNQQENIPIRKQQVENNQQLSLSEGMNKREKLQNHQNYEKFYQSDRKNNTDYSYNDDSYIQEDANKIQINSNQHQPNNKNNYSSYQDKQQEKQIKMYTDRDYGREKARLFDQFSSKKQLRFATDGDAVIEEEDLSFDELRNKKFNGEFNDSLYKEQFVKNFFSKNSKEQGNNSILSEIGFPKI